MTRKRSARTKRRVVSYPRNSTSRQMISMRRRMRKRRGARGGVSPLSTPRTGKGFGFVSTRRRKRAAARLSAKKRVQVKVRKVLPANSEWRYEVYFHHPSTKRRAVELAATHEALRAFIRSSNFGTYKLKRSMCPYYPRGHLLITWLKLTDEADLFTLMLCHGDLVFKIFERKAEEAPKGL